MKKLLVFSSLILFLIIIFFLYKYSNNRMSPPDQYCHSIPSKSKVNLNILIIGESWAAKGRLLPHASQTIYSKMNIPITVCTVGFSGRNTKKLFNEIEYTYNNDYFNKLFEGNIDKVVLLTGVNDVVGHVGKINYTSNLQKVINKLPESKVYVMEVPYVDVFTNKNVSLPSLIKRRVQWSLNDKFDNNPIQSYRDHVKNNIKNINIIPFDPFLNNLKLNKDSYEPDGIHLTTKEFNRYGVYIGEFISKN